MRYQISGKQIDIGDALQTHVKTELSAAVGKYAERAIDANVVFSRDAHEYVCETVVHLSTGLTASAKARATEIYAAFDNCCEKMEKQLRRYKRRLKDHYRERTEPVELMEGASYILSTGEDNEEAEPETLQPMIIAEMETRVPTISVGEAVMQMELAGTNLLVFRNEKTGKVNVVHSREDGNVGWIDP
ncbi:ribosomal subunit interface protein [Rhodovulum imhoffii]|uniref:Ribosome hibernation promoting factor n=1 Tax=Rhodovulum imhoffii TaxID=365340 RepID=A0A2T5BPC0_9RHOB|nr:ribosome-associated translation inhibitor RaiA [Rhodovulum imhoffii]MBK5932915.1 ribosomal subunit interface protein [Rhodovulum imhoffii]PTN00851.1 ribosomal subunit interface protein [Rhodovulum imhoffii]